MFRKLAIIAAMVVALGGLAACGDDDDGDTASPATTTTGAPAGATTTTVAGEAQPILCDGESAYSTEIGNPENFQPVKEDTLSVVTSLPGPGFWEGSDTDPAKVTSGFEYDIAVELQEAFNLANLDVRNVSFDAIVAGTVTDYDIALSQITIRCDRAAVADFTMPYFESNQGVLTKSSFSKPLTTVEDAKKLQWGIQTGTTAKDLLDEIQPEKETRVYQQLTDAYTALEAGQVEAVLIDTAINLGQAARSNGTLKVPAQFAQPGGADQYGAMIPTDSPNAGAINAVFQELKDTGDLDALIEKDLSANLADLPLITVIEVGG
jgi:polar amino acid transport system substrate-binding protein